MQRSTSNEGVHTEAIVGHRKRRRHPPPQGGHNKSQRRLATENAIHTCRCDEMVDVADSKSAAGDSVPVRVRSPAPYRVFITDLTVVDTRFSFSAILLAEMEFVCTNSLLVTVSDSNAPCTLSTINLRLSEKLLFGCVIATSINL